MADLTAIHGNRHLHGLDADLDIALARQGAKGEGGSRGSDVPLPIDPRASEATAILRNTLSTWCRVLIDESPQNPPQDTLASMARWLHTRVPHIRLAQWAGECADEIHAAVTEARRTVDLPPTRAYVGPCPVCGHPVFAPHKSTTGQCRTLDCPGQVDIQAWRDSLPDKARHLALPATELADLLTAMGIPLAPSTVRSWALRRRIRPVRTGDPRYRVADALRLLAPERISA